MTVLGILGWGGLNTVIRLTKASFRLRLRVPTLRSRLLGWVVRFSI